MTAELSTVEAMRYTNRPPRPLPADRCPGAPGESGRRSDVRAMDRILLCLRAYEQRAASRAALREWIAARAAVAPAAA